MRFALYLLAASLALPPLAGAAFAQSTDCSTVGISAEEAPPPLPDYDQPPVPGPGYQWTPGYWAWNNVDYYWVPGTWIEPPQPEVLWTPPYWAFIDGAYVFHRGYWGPHVGFYGGVNYGYGYGGDGFEGGRWDHGTFFYNRSVTNINNVNITNVYNKTVIVNNNSRVSFNGGRDGLTAKPTAADEAIAREPHIPPTHAQTAHLRAASLNSDSFASANHGRPTVAATSHPGDFKGPGVTATGTSHREHENGMTGPATGGMSHENRGPAVTQGQPHEGGAPVDNRRLRERNPEATRGQPHTPPGHPQRVAEPKPPREAPHRAERPQPHPQAPRPQPHREPPRPQPHPQPHGGGGGGRPHEEHKR
jgi:hypothetical protein